VGRKGEGRFERVFVGRALADIAARLKKIAAVDAQRIVPYSYAARWAWCGEAMAAASSTSSRPVSSTARSAPVAGGEALGYTLGLRPPAMRPSPMRS